MDEDDEDDEEQSEHDRTMAYGGAFIHFRNQHQIQSKLDKQKKELVKQNSLIAKQNRQLEQTQQTNETRMEIEQERLFLEQNRYELERLDIEKKEIIALKIKSTRQTMSAMNKELDSIENSFL
jgi:hypothetical protein